MLSLYPNFFLEMIVAYHINFSLTLSKKKKRKKKEKKKFIGGLEDAV